jgi:hypothetical protein
MRSQKYNIWGLNKTRVNLRWQRNMKALPTTRKRPLASQRFMNENLARFMGTWSSKESLTELWSLL